MSIILQMTCVRHTEPKPFTERTIYNIHTY